LYPNNHDDGRSLGNRPPISKSAPHACRAVSSTLHAYELM